MHAAVDLMTPQRHSNLDEMTDRPSALPFPKLCIRFQILHCFVAVLTLWSCQKTILFQPLRNLGSTIFYENICLRCREEETGFNRRDSPQRLQSCSRNQSKAEEVPCQQWTSHLPGQTAHSQIVGAREARSTSRRSNTVMMKQHSSHGAYVSSSLVPVMQHMKTS